jgi:DNA invertase Pin-like site-specific DNA recombinase
MIASDKPPVPAVAYYRMSTDRQDKSIASQKNEVEQYAAKHGYTILREYKDEGISGDDTERRKGFQRMVADARDRGDFDAILCWDQDRFGRFNSLEAGFWIHPLMQAGIHLATIAQGRIDWEEFAGRLLFAIQQEGKNQYLVDLARNVARGLRDRYVQGKWCGKAPYGYVVGPDGHLAFGDQQEIATVRAIFRMRADEGLGYGTIAMRLNAKGVPAPRGGNWNVPGVRNILTRENYTGTMVLGIDQRAKHYAIMGGEVVRVKRGAAKREPMRIENAHPAIIDRKTWDTCAAFTTCSIKIKSHGRKGKEGASLASLLFCGRCGSPMYAVEYAGRGAAYLCAKNHTKGGCGHCKVPQAAALQMVAKIIRERVLQGSLEALEAAVARQLGRKAQAAEVGDVRRQIADLDRKIENATDRLVTVDAALVPPIEKKLLALQAQRKELAAQSKIKPPKRADPKAIAAQIWELDEVLAKGSPAKVRFALSKIVKRITLNFKEGKKTGRGQSFVFTGGTMELFTKDYQEPRRRRWLIARLAISWPRTSAK